MSKKKTKMNNLISYFVNHDKILDEKMFNEIKKDKSIHNKIVEIGNEINVSKEVYSMSSVEKGNTKKKITIINNYSGKIHQGAENFLFKIFYDLKLHGFLDKSNKLKDKKNFFFIMCPGNSPSKLVAFINIVFKKELNKYHIKLVHFNVSGIKEFNKNKPKLLEKIIMDGIEETKKVNKIQDKSNIHFGFYDAIFTGQGVGIINKFLKKNGYSTIKDIDSKNHTLDLLPPNIIDKKNTDFFYSLLDLPFLIVQLPEETMFDVSELHKFKYNKKNYHSRCTKHAHFTRSRNRKTSIDGITFCNILIYYSILKYKKKKNMFKLKTHAPISRKNNI